MKGFILTKPELQTTVLPETLYTKGPTPDSLSDLYESSLTSAILPVIKEAVDRSGFMVLAHSYKCGYFIWFIDSSDVYLYIPMSETRNKID